jgi:hypothetical protein
MTKFTKKERIGMLRQLTSLLVALPKKRWLMKSENQLG